jgi:opacity protein-like surface antigen
MTNIQKTICVFSALLMSAFVAQGSVYIGGSAGYLIDAEEPVYSGRVGVVLGTAAGIRHSIEAEMGFSSASYGIYEIDMQPLMANYRGQIDLSEILFLYAGAGAGRVSVDVEFFNSKGSGDAFAWQAFGGLGLRLTSSLSLMGGVRYFDSSEVTVRKNKIGAENDFEFGLGMQLDF